MDQSLQNKQNIPPNYDVIFIWSALKKLSLHDIFVNIIKCGLDWIFCVNLQTKMTFYADTKWERSAYGYSWKKLQSLI